ncbi:HAD family hydrolase [Candidatus Woesearchaeota archaeon]|nr:HAD family hydrolase [Candidatus Woesearchaeota archaeon]
MTKAILFDFWGTLAENGTYSPLRQSYTILRPRMPFGEFAEQFENAFMTKKFDEQKEGFTAVCEALNIPVKSFIIDKLIGLWNKNRMLAKLYPETTKVLEELKKKGYKLALVSNTDALIQQVIERLDVAKYFDAFVFSYETGTLKTNPEFYETALKELKVKKTEAIIVGDSIETDMLGAEKAEIKAVLVDRKNKREYENKIQNLEELEQFLEK